MDPFGVLEGTSAVPQFPPWQCFFQKILINVFLLLISFHQIIFLSFSLTLFSHSSTSARGQVTSLDVIFI